MRIYVATSIRNKNWAAKACERLSGMGHTITYNWAAEYHSAPDNSLTQEQALRAAVNDLYLGVQTSELVICHAEFEVMLGAPIEVGAAIAWGKQVWVVRPYRYSVFWELPNVEWLPTEREMWERLGWPQEELARVNQLGGS